MDGEVVLISFEFMERVVACCFRFALKGYAVFFPLFFSVRTVHPVRLVHRGSPLVCRIPSCHRSSTMCDDPTRLTRRNGTTLKLPWNGTIGPPWNCTLVWTTSTDSTRLVPKSKLWPRNLAGKLLNEDGMPPRQCIVVRAETVEEEVGNARAVLMDATLVCDEDSRHERLYNARRAPGITMLQGTPYRRLYAVQARPSWRRCGHHAKHVRRSRHQKGRATSQALLTGLELVHSRTLDTTRSNVSGEIAKNIPLSRLMDSNHRNR